MKYNNYSFTREANTYYDQGLRAYMLSIYQNMSMALGISALLLILLRICKVNLSISIDIVCTNMVRCTNVNN
ncbi:hypothetical protein MPCS_01527 (plasmid) [Candidatus Megaera polyxenophila]|nr:hypothetical protein MPCS_01527 [Candidatus Megaera polyxenophila]